MARFSLFVMSRFYVIAPRYMKGDITRSNFISGGVLHCAVTGQENVPLCAVG